MMLEMFDEEYKEFEAKVEKWWKELSQERKILIYQFFRRYDESKQ